MRRFGATVGALVMAVGACGGAPPVPVSRSEAPLMGDTWFAARAQALGVTIEAARGRDAALSESAPPETTDDPALSRQSAALWQTVCATCHGATGHLENVPPADPRPRELGTFGMSMGFFFGGDRMRAGLYRKIAYGLPPAKSAAPSPMPKWAGTLAREQIWALVRHIERL